MNEWRRSGDRSTTALSRWVTNDLIAISTHDEIPARPTLPARAQKYLARRFYPETLVCDFAVCMSGPYVVCYARSPAQLAARSRYPRSGCYAVLVDPVHRRHDAVIDGSPVGAERRKVRPLHQRLCVNWPSCTIPDQAVHVQTISRGGGVSK